MSFFGYCRVSTQRQVVEGESLEVQRRQIEGYASMHGWPVPDTRTEEGVSGSKPLEDRPIGGKLILELKNGDILIAAKLDRLFRSALDALTMVDVFKKRGIHLHLLDLGGDISGNGLGKLFLTIAAAFAEAERDRIRARISETKADQRTRGRHLGGSRPFGYQKVRAHSDDKGFDLVEDEHEQAAIPIIMKMHEEGISLRDIAKVLRTDGYSITHTAVSNVIKRKRAHE